MKQKKRFITISSTILSGLLAATSSVLASVVANEIQQGLRIAFLAFCIITIIGIGLSLWQIFNQEKKEDPLEVQERKNLHRLRTKVHSYWITGVLERSLYHDVLITLRLQGQPHAVIHTWNLTAEHRDQPSYALPEGTRIREVFDAAEGQLLILGEPGSGKTTLLLELTRDLLDRAQQNGTLPIPVVFNLSSWALKRLPLATWLVEELNTKYQVSRKLGQLWVEHAQILPLFDGLDEVAAIHRAACIDAINLYQEERRADAQLVLCCRSTSISTSPDASRYRML